MSPTVTAIVPSRDCFAYLPSALASIEAQGRADLEVIVVDDGSTDATGPWLDELRRKVSWLRVMRTEGVGPNEARNIALRESRSNLVAFLDADDAWLPGKIASQIAFHFENPGIAFSFTDYLHIDPAGGTHGGCFEFWPSFARVAAGASGFRELDRPLARLLAENVVGTSTVVAQRDLLLELGGFDGRLKSAADWDLWLRMAGAGRVAFSPECLAHYLMRPGSVSSNMALRLDCMRQIVDRHRPAAERQDPRAVRMAEARILTGRAELARSEGHPVHALAHHIDAFLKAPSRRAGRAVLSDAAAAATDIITRPLRRGTD